MTKSNKEVAQVDNLTPQTEQNETVTETTSMASFENQKGSADNSTIEALLAKSEQLESMEEVVSLSPESITLDKVGESFRGIFMGYGEMTINDENAPEKKRTIPSAKFLINKAMRINGGAVLISELKNAGVVEGTPLQVTYTEKRGNVKIYRITLLG